MPSTIFTLLVKDIEQLHTEKQKNWFKLKYNSQETSRQEITKAFSLPSADNSSEAWQYPKTTHPALPEKKIFQSQEQMTFFFLFTMCNFIYFFIYFFYFCIKFYSILHILPILLFFALQFLHPVVKKKKIILLAPKPLSI